VGSIIQRSNSQFFNAVAYVVKKKNAVASESNQAKKDAIDIAGTINQLTLIGVLRKIAAQTVGRVRPQLLSSTLQVCQ
jgi:hypothetical protein